MTGQQFKDKNIVIIGDSTRDIECGKLFHALTIAVATSSHSKVRLSTVGADYLFDNLKDYKKVLKATGLPCNPHTFLRTFACLPRKAGVDTMTIKDLGRWESLEMVQRYTRSITFQDSLKFYKAPLG